jgi:hypothetical protein
MRYETPELSLVANASAIVLGPPDARPTDVDATVNSSAGDLVLGLD